jgi:hypothetical protein
VKFETSGSTAQAGRQGFGWLGEPLPLIEGVSTGAVKPHSARR